MFQCQRIVLGKSEYAMEMPQSQTYPWHYDEQTQNTDNFMTIRTQVQ